MRLILLNEEAGRPGRETTAALARDAIKTNIQSHSSFAAVRESGKGGSKLLQDGSRSQDHKYNERNKRLVDLVTVSCKGSNHIRSRTFLGSVVVSLNPPNPYVNSPGSYKLTRPRVRMCVYVSVCVCVCVCV